MSTKRTIARALPAGILLGLFLGLFVSSPVFGQALPEENFRLSAFFGHCFDSVEYTTGCPIMMASFQAYRVSRYLPWKSNRRFQPTLWAGNAGFPAKQQASRGTEASLALTVLAALGDTWPVPGGDGNTSAPKRSDDIIERPAWVEHTTMAFLVDLILPVPVEPRFLIEPFVGGGMTQIFEKDQEGRNFAVLKEGILTASYGLTVTSHGFLWSDRLDLMFQYRGLVFFPKDLKYLGPGAQRYELDKVASISTTALLVGVGFRF